MPPVTALVAGAAGTGYAGYQLYKHIPGWIQDSEVVMHRENYSNDEVQAANSGAERIGSGSVDTATGIARATVGGFAGNALKASLIAKGAAANSDAINEAATPVDKLTESSNVATQQGQTAPAAT